MKTRITRFAIVVAILTAVAVLSHPVQADEFKKRVYDETLHGTALVISDSGSGTCWIVNAEKHLLITCEHVVKGSQSVKVVFPEFKDGRVVTRKAHYSAPSKAVTGRVVRVDAKRDLALIEVDGLPEGARELKLAAQEPQPAEAVHTVGCPGASGALWVYSNGRVRVVTEATWSDSSRQRRSAVVVESTVPLNPGDSGGALVNDNGEVVGVNQSIDRAAQLFALSTDASEVKKFLTGSDEADKIQRLLDEARQATSAKDWSKAKRLLKEAAELDEKSEDVLIELAIACNRTNDHRAAIAFCRYVLEELNRRNSDAFRELGLAFRELGKQARQQDISRATSLAMVGGSPIAVSALATQMKKSEAVKLWAMSISALLRAVDLKPTDAAAWDGLIDVLELAGQKAAAERAREERDLAR